MRKIIGITGGIASGKSTAIKYLMDKGFYIIDSDTISRDLTSTNGKAIKPIIDIFGSEYIDNTLSMDRKKMSDLVFNNEVERKKLNDIIHPLVYKEIEDKIRNSNDDIIFVDVPLLFEASFERLFDWIILIYVDLQTQIRRLCERNNISNEEALKIINSQMELSKKIELSDFVVENGKTKEDLYKKIDNILKIIKE